MVPLFSHQTGRIVKIISEEKVIIIRDISLWNPYDLEKIQGGTKEYSWKFKASARIKGVLSRGVIW